MIEAGTKFGRGEILSPLGAGGRARFLIKN